MNLLGGLTPQLIGNLLVGLAYGGILLITWRRFSERTLVWAAMACFFAFFMLLTRMHERYLFPTVTFGALLAALVMCAAVADYRPRTSSAGKLKRSSAPLSLELVPNPDLLAEIGQRRAGGAPLLLGFAVETEAGERLVAAAREKLSSSATARK